MDKKTRDDMKEKFSEYDDELGKISHDLFAICSPLKDGNATKQYEHVVISVAALTRVLSEVIRLFGVLDIISKDSTEHLRHVVGMIDRAIGVALVKKSMERFNTTPTNGTSLDDLDVSKATKQ